MLESVNRVETRVYFRLVITGVSLWRHDFAQAGLRDMHQPPVERRDGVCSEGALLVYIPPKSIAIALKKVSLVLIARRV